MRHVKVFGYEDGSKLLVGKAMTNQDLEALGREAQRRFGRRNVVFENESGKSLWHWKEKRNYLNIGKMHAEAISFRETFPRMFRTAIASGFIGLVVAILFWPDRWGWSVLIAAAIGAFGRETLFNLVFLFATIEE